MIKFKDILAENMSLTEAANNKREKLFNKICEGKKLSSTSGLSDLGWGNSNTTWYCMITDEDDKEIILDQRLIWGDRGFYELYISSDTKHYNFKKEKVGDFELFQDAIKVMEKNIIFVKNNFGSNTKIDIKKFS